MIQLPKGYMVLNAKELETMKNGESVRVVIYAHKWRAVLKCILKNMVSPFTAYKVITIDCWAKEEGEADDTTKEVHD